MSLVHTLLPFWLLLFFGTIIAVLFNLGTVAACLLLRVKFTKIAVFYGKPVLTIDTRFVEGGEVVGVGIGEGFAGGARSDCRGQAAPLVKPPKATIGQKLKC
jgi:hypothetical protein